MSWSILLVASLCAAELWAQEPPRVALMGPHVYVDPLVTMVPRLGEQQWSRGQIAAQLEAGVSKQLRGQGAPRVSYLDGAQLRAGVTSQPGYISGVDRAREQAELGLERYKELDTKAAIPLLERALERYRATRHELVSPQEVADVLLYLTLSTLEEAQSARPLEWMRALVLLDPERALQKGYYPDSVVEFYQVARANVLRELRQRGPGVEAIEDAAALSSLLKLDGLYYIAVYSQEDGRYQVAMYAYDSSARRFDAAEVITLDQLTSESLSSASGELIARFMPCLISPEQAPRLDPIQPSTGQSAWSVELHMAYASFLRYPSPIQTPYGNYGLGMGVRWRLTEEFGLIGRAQVLIAQRDRNGLLFTEDFSTLRAFLGGELAITLWSYLTLGMQITLDMTRVNDFEVWPLPGCAANPLDPRCNRIVYDDIDIMLGTNARPFASLRIYDSLSLFIGGSVSYYFFSRSSVNMNFPVSIEGGMQYRF